LRQEVENMPSRTAKSQATNWNDLRYLLAVAQGGTLSAAARRLRVDETTVARRLAAAETALGARLFDRVDGVLRLTTAGEVAVAHAERVEREMHALGNRIAGADAAVAGTVRLTAVPILVNHLLVPALPDLYAAHPLLRLELIAEPRNLSLTKREADIALRLARPRGGGTAVARRIGRLDYAVFAPRRGDPDRLPWITYEEGMDELPQAKWIAAAARTAPGPPALLVNDAERRSSRPCGRGSASRCCPARWRSGSRTCAGLEAWRRCCRASCGCWCMRTCGGWRESRRSSGGSRGRYRQSRRGGRTAE